MIEKTVRTEKASQHNHIKGAWATATEIDKGDWYHHGGVTYECTAGHTSAAGTEPGVGASWNTVWQYACLGNATVSATAIVHYPAYSVGQLYHVKDFVKEAKAGYGASRWICISEHTGAAGKNPTGASGATYWEEWNEGGINGVNDLAGTLDALSTYTDPVVGATDLVFGKFGGSYGFVTPDTYSQGYVLHEIDAGAIVPDSASGSPCGAAENLHSTTKYLGGRYCPFAHDQKRYGHFKYRLPLSYNGGTIKAYIECISLGTTSDSYCFGIQGRAFGDGDSLIQDLGAAVEVVDTCQGAEYEMLESAIFDDITLAGTPAAGKHVQFRIYRDPANGGDDLAETIYLGNIMLLVPVNKKSEA